MFYDTLSSLVVVVVLLLCIEEANGEAVRLFSPGCHILPKLAHVPLKTVE